MVSEARSGVTKHGYGAGCNLHAAILRVRLKREGGARMAEGEAPYFYNNN